MKRNGETDSGLTKRAGFEGRKNQWDSPGLQTEMMESLGGKDLFCSEVD